MAHKINFSELKARAIDSGVDEEAVTVNTRALIDKVLARYSGEWTVLRELLQNASDASATHVTVKLETLPSTTVPVPPAADDSASIKHVISNHTVKRLVLRNNGIPFSGNDWARLKRIAEGNPDETKIGAFGVGFYSVFSDCEEPFVSSGREAMAFYWKGNALFTRRLQLQGEDSSPDTTFVLDYRNTTSPIPALLPLCQFLASSLTFINVQTIDLWLDNWNVLKLVKKLAPGVPVTIPRDVRTQTEEGMMKVRSVTREVAQLDASWMTAVGWKPSTISSRLEDLRTGETASSLRSFFSRLTRSAGDSRDTAAEEASHQNRSQEDLISSKSSSIFLHITTAQLQTSVSQSFSQELQRATKKPPPKTTSLAVLTSSYTSSSPGKPHEKQDVFDTVLPSKSGRIYIGFPTHQTTGLSAHISAPSLIPTVERESIDLNARWVRTWNMEILRAAGAVCRIAWAAEMSALKDRLTPKTSQSRPGVLQKEVINPVLPEAVHMSNQFVFRESTPASQVGQVVENSFWTCSQNAYLELLSSCGVLPSHQVRISPKDLSFVNAIPVVPEELMTGAKDFVSRLIEFGLITEITVSDIKKELESKPLTTQQLGEFLSWMIKRALNNELDRLTIKSLLSAAVASDESSDGGSCGILVLKDITNFLNPSRIPADFPFPTTVMPFKYSKPFSRHELEALGWGELQLDPWIRWLIESDKRRSLPPDQNITLSAPFSARVLPVLSKQWDALPPASRGELIKLLQKHTVIPTKLGMKKPTEAYFPTVRLFDDLPVVSGLNNVKERFLMSLGVRKTVDLNVIFERLLGDPTDPHNEKSANKPQWSHVELIKYLASVRSDIPSQDITKLKEAKICTAESPDPSVSSRRHRVSELFEPKAALRDINLPVIYWPGRYQSDSAEGKFLALLGLKTHPSPSELVQIMGIASEKDTSLQERCINYFVSAHVRNGYDYFDYSKVTLPFVPVQGGKRSTPSQCFTSPGAALFGFELIRKDLEPHAAKFGVRQHPPVHSCINFMFRKPPLSTKQAREYFEYFAGRIAEIDRGTAERIGRAGIVPITSSTGDIRYTAPQDCYLGYSEDYADIFDFVSFGNEGNLFLLACGSKREPTKVELASILVKEPARISSTLRTPEKYLKLLRSIAESMQLIKRDKALFKQMKTAPFLFASKEIPVNTSQQTTEKTLVDVYDDEESQSMKEWQLVRAADAVIVDDYTSFNLFKESVLAAPQEEALEDMYMQLGTPCLSSLIVEDVRCGPPSHQQDSAVKLRKRIYERTKLFLHDLPNDAIKHNSRWLEKNLTVQAVQAIRLRRSLRGRIHDEKRSAAVKQVQNGSVLCISVGHVDFYQVSQALVHLLLSRPKLHSTLTLEMLLKTDLLELRARGYNVERILRQKAAEARIAETERQKRLEDEQRQAQEAEEVRRRQIQEAPEPSVHESMPGFFPDAPASPPRGEQPNGSQDNNRGVRGLFSNLTQRFGIDDPFRSQPAAEPKRLNPPEDAPPPPYSADDPSAQGKEGTKGVNNPPGNSDPSKTTSNNNPTNPAPVISPIGIRHNLTSAIKSCRAPGDTSISSSGLVTQELETKSYCDERPAVDLVYISTCLNIKLFLNKNNPDAANFTHTNSTGLQAFASILCECLKLFELPAGSISMFYEPAGRTIGFNRSKSVFCNYHYFQQLHQHKVLEGHPEDALIYWFTVLCHELAHNIVEAHNSEHSFFTESFVTEYFRKVSVQLIQYELRRNQQAAPIIGTTWGDQSLI